MEPTVYTAVYGGFDQVRVQPVPVLLFTDKTHPLPDARNPRMAAKWWKVFPHLAVPDAEVTVWIDGTQVIRESTFPQEMLDLLGDDDLMLFRHEKRNCILDEMIESRRGVKYDSMPLEQQVASYRAAGHPRRWGLMHACCIVRRDTPATRALDEAWWSEIERWSEQDQLSLPYVLRRSSVRWHWAPSPVARWLRQERHALPDVWRSRAKWG